MVGTVFLPHIAIETIRSNNKDIKLCLYDCQTVEETVENKFDEYFHYEQSKNKTPSFI